MLKSKNEIEAFVPLKKKKKYVYLEKYQFNKVTTDMKINALEKAIKAIHFVLIMMAVAGIILTIWQSIK
jgi:hypothetical protein